MVIQNIMIFMLIVGLGNQGGLVPTEAPIISDEYSLAPGDELLVTVTGRVNYSYLAPVTYEGKLIIRLPNERLHGEKELAEYYNIVDAIPVAGLTIKLAEDSLSRHFLRYLRDISIKLTLVNVHAGIVFVSGEVQKPGIYYATPFDRVSQVIEKAGGITPVGSKQSVIIVRKNHDTIRVNLEEFELNGAIENNPRVEYADIIHVPRVKATVTVKGAVYGRGESKLRVSALTTEKERISEGVYELGEEEGISDIIYKAGGVTPWADLINAYIERIDNKTGTRIKIPVNLYDILYLNDQKNNRILKHGDILVVPPTNTLVYVQGEVHNPGAFLFTPNLKSDDYIGQAGGPTHYANKKKIHIFRNGRRISARSNPIIEPGDVIIVPRTTFKWWQDYATIISSIAVPIATALLYIRLSQ
ncbi:MAG: SLBB domain-containing protein [candidate division WOR-3 bacterium]|nr:SLBB domain-containing protein [candidate division WOR-3 bacterium]